MVSRIGELEEPLLPSRDTKRFSRSLVEIWGVFWEELEVGGSGKDVLEKDIYSSRNPRRMVETEGLVMSTPCDVEDAILVLMLLLTMGK